MLMFEKIFHAQNYLEKNNLQPGFSYSNLKRKILKEIKSIIQNNNVKLTYTFYSKDIIYDMLKSEWEYPDPQFLVPIKFRFTTGKYNNNKAFVKAYYIDYGDNILVILYSEIKSEYSKNIIVIPYFTYKDDDKNHTDTKTLKHESMFDGHFPRFIYIQDDKKKKHDNYIELIFPFEKYNTTLYVTFYNEFHTKSNEMKLSYFFKPFNKLKNYLNYMVCNKKILDERIFKSDDYLIFENIVIIPYNEYTMNFFKRIKENNMNINNYGSLNDENDKIIYMLSE